MRNCTCIFLTLCKCMCVNVSVSSVYLSTGSVSGKWETERARWSRSVEPLLSNERVNKPRWKRAWCSCGKSVSCHSFQTQVGMKWEKRKPICLILNRFLSFRPGIARGQRDRLMVADVLSTAGMQNKEYSIEVEPQISLIEPMLLILYTRITYETNLSNFVLFLVV